MSVETVRAVRQFGKFDYSDYQWSIPNCLETVISRSIRVYDWVISNVCFWENVYEIQIKNEIQ